MTGDWCGCGKRAYKTWSHARYDAKAINQSQKARRVHVYYSRPCRAIHVGHRPSNRKDRRP